MKGLVRLYPRAWRERYGAEFGEILADKRPSIGLIVDVIAGAIDARVSPQPIATRYKIASPQGESMTVTQLMK